MPTCTSPWAANACTTGAILTKFGRAPTTQRTRRREAWTLAMARKNARPSGVLPSVHRTRIAISPPYERHARRRLFDALEATLPVVFEGRAAGDVAGADAAILLPAAAGGA